MGVMFRHMLGERPHYSKIGQGSQAIESTREPPRSQTRRSPTCRRRNGVRRKGIGARTTSLRTPDAVFRIILDPIALSCGRGVSIGISNWGTVEYCIGVL